MRIKTACIYLCLLLLGIFVAPQDVLATRIPASDSILVGSGSLGWDQAAVKNMEMLPRPGSIVFLGISSNTAYYTDMKLKASLAPVLGMNDYGAGGWASIGPGVSQDRDYDNPQNEGYHPYIKDSNSFRRWIEIPENAGKAAANYSYYFYRGRSDYAPNMNYRVYIAYDTYTITPSEYYIDSYTNPSTGQTGIRINWHMIDEPDGIEYRIIRNDNNSGSDWITGTKGNYSWVDYSVQSGTQYSYSIQMRQKVAIYRASFMGLFYDHDAYTGVHSVNLHSVTADVTPPTISEFRLNSSSNYTNNATINLIINATDNTGVAQMRFSNNGGVSWTTWEEYNPSKNYTLPATNGNHTLSVQVKDSMGNLSNIASTTVFLDTVAPTGSFTVNNGATYVNTETVTLVLNATDASPSSTITSVQISNEDADFTGRPWESFAGNKSWIIPDGEGPKTIYLRYKDGAGNISPTYSKTVILDKTPPTGTLEIQSKDGLPKTFSPEVVLNITGQDSVAGIKGIQVSNNGTAWGDIIPLTSPLDHTLSPGGGTKTVYVRLIDNAGNITLLSDDIAYSEDVIQPVVNLSINNGAVSTTNPQVTLNISAYDNVTPPDQLQMAISNDNINWSQWEPLAESKVWNITEGYGGTATPGTKTVFIKVADAESNIGYARCSIGYNTTTPKLNNDLIQVDGRGFLEIDGKKTFVSNKNCLSIKFPFDDAAYYRTAIANGVWGEWAVYTETTEVLTGLGEGITKVKVQAKDSHNVLSDIYSIRILIDSTPPTIHSIKTQNNATAGKGTINITVNASDKYCDKLEYNVGSGWKELNGNISVPLNKGLNNINVQVRDYAHNTASKTISVWGL